jgi:hypothetical protein
MDGRPSSCRHPGAEKEGENMKDTTLWRWEQDHPLMRAWNAHKATPEYANSVSWAQHAEHVEGSMWALFMAGWTAAQGCGCAPGTCESKPQGCWPRLQGSDHDRQTR